ncbi:MAG: hypothetical protein CM15mP103_02480 [Gammaproteobacteria bacterium]|nr:MAG: hypothetical protein CM15mP103_02480 [Gammaproteobacteria bacterium]
MAGDYRTSFDFIETVGFTKGYQPRAPYQSWGTERVYVVANEPDFVSLQHIIVMHFLDADGFESDPWSSSTGGRIGGTRMQKYTLFRGVGPLFDEHDPASRKGAWTQTVYQVTTHLDTRR